jgi:hypothetical protein
MGFLTDLLIDILVSALSRIVTGQLSASVESLARWVIGKAVDRLPADDREGFREQWLRDMEDTCGAVGKLRHALGCYVGAPVVGELLANQQKRRQQVRGKTVTDIHFKMGTGRTHYYIQCKNQYVGESGELKERLAAIQKLLYNR